LEGFDGAPVLVVMFLCNHCPFVIHVLDELDRLVSEYIAKGVAFVAINSNDVEAYPQDAPDRMRELALERQWQFPYLFDETQEVAKAYRAACTPDFFVFDSKRALVYRGRLDASRPETGIAPSGADLRAALEAALVGEKPAGEQHPSMGCNIKWRAGNEPEYFR